MLVCLRSHSYVPILAVPSLYLCVCQCFQNKERKEFGSWTTIASLLAFHHSVKKLFACFTQVFSELNGDSWSSLPALRNCIGNIQEDRENSIMEAEMASQRGDADTGEVCYTLIALIKIKIKIKIIALKHPPHVKVPCYCSHFRRLPFPVSGVSGCSGVSHLHFQCRDDVSEMK